MDLAIYKRHAHHLLDQLDRGQLDAVVRLLEVMADPAARAIANAPIDAGPVTEEEERALNEAREWLQHNKPTPHDSGAGRTRHHTGRDRELSGSGVKRIAWTGQMTL